MIKSGSLFVVLGIELKGALSLNDTDSPLYSETRVPRLTLKLSSSCLSLPSSGDPRHVILCLASLLLACLAAKISS